MTENNVYAKKTSQPFFILAALTFILASIAGVLASFEIAIPDLKYSIFPFEKLRPLHTFFPIVGVLSGSYGWIVFSSVKEKKKISLMLSRLSFLALLLFFIAAGASLLLGGFSGREYFSWPPIYSIPLILSIFVVFYLFFNNFKSLAKNSPEGSWLVGFGIIFILIGLSESLGWLMPSIGNNFVKDLTLQWHGIDTFFAGLNALLYGVGVFVLQKEPKPLRKQWLYVIAISSLLFTFGHHHYVSPQPHFLKILAFIASMIAMFSFVKHFRAFRKLQKEKKGSGTVMETLFRGVGLWTVFSFGTGILFAIPQMNLVVHGTYLIVMHAMASMIGVQLLLVFVGGFHIFDVVNQKSAYKIKLGIKMLNITLISICVLMSIVGIIKGVMRPDHLFLEFNSTMQYYLYLLPVLGILLLISISLISVELIRSCAWVNKNMVKP